MDFNQVKAAFNSMVKLNTFALQRGLFQNLPECQEMLGALEVLQSYLVEQAKTAASKPVLKAVPEASAAPEKAE
jgi:hypothetical protein